MHFFLVFGLLTVLAQAPSTFGFEPCILQEHVYYTIVNPGDGRALSVDVASGKSKKLILSVPTGGDYDKWSVTSEFQHPVGTYAFINKGTGTLIAIKESNARKNVVLAAYNDTGVRAFRAIGDPAHCVLKLPRTESYVVSERPTSANRVGRVFTAEKLTAKNVHAWKFEALPCAPHPKRAYRLIQRLNNGTVGFAPDEEKATVFFNETEKEENSAEENLQFVPSDDSPDVYFIRQVKSGRFLAVENHVDHKGAVIVRESQHDGSCQKFHLKPNPDKTTCSLVNMGSYRLLAPEVVDDEWRVAQMEKTQTLASQWILEPEKKI